MLHSIILLSLIITGIFIVFQQGMFLGWARAILATQLDELCMFCCKKLKVKNALVTGSKISVIIQKPLWDCLPCMSGLWVIVITRSFDIVLILAVCGLNAVIAKTLDYETSVGG
jgi:hypothetical protein